MVSKNSQPATVDEYIAQFPEDMQQIMQKLRAVIKETAPEAEEKISYGMAGYYLNGGLIWFGGYKKHIGIYPRSSAMLATIKELSKYKGTKGSVHFPLDQPMPYALIRKMVEIRVAENTKK
ncbi:MAG: iron chaperone [Bellilinea sp.]